MGSMNVYVQVTIPVYFVTKRGDAYTVYSFTVIEKFFPYENKLIIESWIEKQSPDSLFVYKKLISNIRVQIFINMDFWRCQYVIYGFIRIVLTEYSVRGSI